MENITRELMLALLDDLLEADYRLSRAELEREGSIDE